MQHVCMWFVCVQRVCMWCVYSVFVVYVVCVQAWTYAYSQLQCIYTNILGAWMLLAPVLPLEVPNCISQFCYLHCHIVLHLEPREEMLQHVTQLTSHTRSRYTVQMVRLVPCHSTVPDVLHNAYSPSVPLGHCCRQLDCWGQGQQDCMSGATATSNGLHAAVFPQEPQGGRHMDKYVSGLHVKVKYVC